MNAILIMAAKEIREASRNRWVLATTLLLAGLALSLSFLGSAPTGTVGVGSLEVTVVSLASLSIFLLPLIALLLGFDAIVGETERGTMMLLLTYPLSREQLLLGKFLGHAAILCFATVLGYGLAGIVVGLTATEATPEAIQAFATMIGSSVLLGCAFLALGYLVSALVRDRGAAAGAAVAIWLVFVLLYDMAVLGALVADQGRVLSRAAVSAMLLLNPTDAYRLLNLTSFPSVSRLAGMAGVSAQVSLSPWALLATLMAWIVGPLLLTVTLFSRRDR
ncbi:MAG TPA: ABC transporter permease subunit [Hyphomicrobium sp.]|jgi:Cu-processing system permease protein